MRAMRSPLATSTVLLFAAATALPGCKALLGEATVLSGGGATVEIPAGAMPYDVDLQIAVVTPPTPLPAGAALQGEVFALTPHGVPFTAPVTITLPAPEADDLAVLRLNDDSDTTWDQVTADIGGGSAVLESWTFSYYAVVQLSDVEDTEDTEDTGDTEDTEDTEVLDSDGDGFTADVDCDDGDPDVFPGADELCNEVDDDCDKEVDEDAVDGASWWVDSDGDGFGDPTQPATLACDAPKGQVDNDEDCDDAQASAYPGATEIFYDGIDQDCLGGSDYDQDGDGDDSSLHGGGDCDDEDPAISTTAAEVCDDGVDNDCDLALDCADPDCEGAAECDEDCANGLDDDFDGDTDCADADCADDPVCDEVCNNGVDDDLDGFTDCADADCVGTAACIEDCGDGVDNDLDSFTDCADPECVGTAECTEDCTNGVDDDLDTLTDCDDPNCFLHPACGEVCDNDTDDDGDTYVDCADPDCVGDPACVEDCSNGFDDDSDGFADCYDVECFGVPECTEVCDDGADNDVDGLTDCADSDCAGVPECVEVCDDGVDNDVDGLTDCEDGECFGVPECTEVCDNLADDDVDGLADCEDNDCWTEDSCQEIRQIVLDAGQMEVFASGRPTDAGTRTFFATDVTGRLRTKAAAATTWNASCAFSFDEVSFTGYRDASSAFGEESFVAVGGSRVGFSIDPGCVETDSAFLPDDLQLQIAAPGAWAGPALWPTLDLSGATTWTCCWYDAGITSSSGDLNTGFRAAGTLGGTSFTLDADGHAVP
jgi:hypothetical protein